MPDIDRALSTLGATTGDKLIPEVIDPVIRDYVQKNAAILNIVNRVAWPDSNVYTIRKRTARPTATWSPDEASLPSAVRSSYAKATKTVKYLYIKGSVTGPLIQASGSVVNALQTEIQVLSEQIALELGTKLYTGNSGSAPDQLDGIVTQIPTSTPGDEGGTTDLASNNFTLNDIDKMLDDTKGEADVILLSWAARRRLNSLLQPQQRFQSTEIGAGFRVQTYDGIPLIPDRVWDDDTRIVAARRQDLKLLVHQDFNFNELGKVTDAVDFFIKGYFGFAVEGRPVMLKNINLAA
jgi:hypothetical protein